MLEEEEDKKEVEFESGWASIPAEDVAADSGAYAYADAEEETEVEAEAEAAETEAEAAGELADPARLRDTSGAGEARGDPSISREVTARSETAKVWRRQELHLRPFRFRTCEEEKLFTERMSWQSWHFTLFPSCFGDSACIPGVEE